MSVQVRALQSLPRLRLPVAIAVLCGAVVPLSIVALALSLQLAFAERVLPGIRVDGVAVGGVSFAQLRDRVIAESATLGEQQVTLLIGDREWRATYADLGVGADVDAAVT